MKNVYYTITIFFLCVSCVFAQVTTHEQYVMDQGTVQLLVQRANALYQEGKLVDARNLYQDAYAEDSASAAQKSEIQKRLEDLNLRIIFSRIVTDDSTLYTIQPGDSLNRIAKKFNTTVSLLKRSNGLAGDKIYPNDTLKVVANPFSIFVDKSDNVLRLLLGGRLIKTYHVATGKNNSTPVATVTIKDKLIDPTWYHAGAVVPPDSPENILGTRWMGFDLRGYGIHGTTIPESIGTQSTSGCVRMFNHEVEELYSMIPVGTKVVIVD